jgi:hypothetical protein
VVALVEAPRTEDIREGVVVLRRYVPVKHHCISQKVRDFKEIQNLLEVTGLIGGGRPFAAGGVDVEEYICTGVFQSLYVACMPSIWVRDFARDTFIRAYAWIEAVNVYEVWEIVQKWFEVMEGRELNSSFQQSWWQHQATANALVKAWDAGFELERARMEFMGVVAPEFSRLSEYHQLIFMQEICATIKSSTEINKEMEERLGMGEFLPPQTLK